MLKNPTAQFDTMYQTHSDKVRQIVARILHNEDDVDDCTQVLWTKVWHKVQVGESIHNSAAYLKEAARLQALQYRRDRAKARMESLDELMAPRSDDDDDDSPTYEPSADLMAPAFDRSTLEHIRRAVDDLSPALRDTINEFYYEALTAAQIADRHEIPTSTVTRRLSDARAALKRLLFPAAFKEAA
jgi:RNA polymerase sigma factor (sigma-70 family)